MPTISCLIWSFVVLALMVFLPLLLALIALAIREILLGTQSVSWRRRMRGVALLAAVLLAAVLLCGAPLKSIRECLEVPYSNPPPALDDSDLVGTWEAHYMEWGQDTLIVKADGTFKQLYRHRTRDDYVYETTWNPWWVERLPDGRVRLHLQGARYYLEGIRIAEENGIRPACPDSQPDNWWCAEPSPRSFFDPVGQDEVLHMVEQLVLNIRTDSSGELHLLHMRIGGDMGFGIVCQWEEFRRVETG